MIQTSVQIKTYTLYGYFESQECYDNLKIRIFGPTAQPNRKNIFFDIDF